MGTGCVVRFFTTVIQGSSLQGGGFRKWALLLVWLPGCFSEAQGHGGRAVHFWSLALLVPWPQQRVINDLGGEVRLPPCMSKDDLYCENLPPPGSEVNFVAVGVRLEGAGATSQGK